MDLTKMKITIDWQAPVQLTRNSVIIVDENRLPDDVHARQGVYFLSRKHGTKYIPFYIGESSNLRSRLKGHLKSAQIYKVLVGKAADTPIGTGARYFHFGYLKGSFQDGNAQKRRRLVQHYMIRDAILQKHPLLNKQLTKITTHTVEFSGPPKARGIFAKSVEIEA